MGQYAANGTTHPIRATVQLLFVRKENGDIEE